MCMTNRDMTMFATIQNALNGLQGAFSYEKTAMWFSTFVLGLICGERVDGIQAIVNSLDLGNNAYHGLDRMFRSDAIDLSKLRYNWIEVICSNTSPYTFCGRFILVADGVKTPKEGRHMPGVTRLHNNSDTQSKPSSYHGIQAGAIGILVHGPDGCANPNEVYYVPISMELMYGLNPVTTWEGTPHPDADQPLEVQMLNRQVDYIKQLGPSLLIQDRASMTQTLFSELESLRLGPDKVDVYMLTNAKSNVKAYELPGPYSGRGRPRIRGDKVKLSTWFKDRADKFRTGKAWIYGKKVKFKYLSEVLLWGDEWNGKLKFILVQMKDGRKIILATDDLEMSPAKAAELYARRFLCEESFRSFKGDFHGMAYHFWTKSMEHLSHFRSKELPHILESAKTPHERERILATIKAAEVYMQGACIAQGITQLISMDTPVGGTVQSYTRKRNHTHRKVSERDIRNYLRGHMDVVFTKYAKDPLIQFICARQRNELDDAWNII